MPPLPISFQNEIPVQKQFPFFIFPNKVLAGETYLIRQAVRNGNKQVIMEFMISIGSPTGMTMNWDSWQQDLDISYLQGVIQTKCHIRNAGKVKIGIYTGYGALIRNVVSEYHPVGVYSKPIDFKAMNLPKSVYLIKLSYLGHTETRVSISAINRHCALLEHTILKRHSYRKISQAILSV